MPFGRSTAPSGWLACDGAEVAIATYGTLSTAIYVGDGDNADADLVYGFKTNGSGTRSTTGTHIKLPDLRGEFIRGWDNARGIDSSRKNRSYQADEIKAHTHAVTDPGHIHNIQYYQSTGGGTAGI
jgi:microcystin-dependent protein